MIIFGAIVIGLIVVGFLLRASEKKQKIESIKSFEECVQAGYGTMESDPPQCKTPDGRFFTGD